MHNNIELLVIDGSFNRPDVSFNPNGKLVLSGRSIVENAIRFYEPILEWVDKYCDNPAELTEFHIKLEYFNTSTSKYILSIIEKFEALYNEGKEVKIFWYSSDEEMEELGEDYSAMLDVPFVFMEYFK